MYKGMYHDFVIGYIYVQGPQTREHMHYRLEMESQRRNRCPILE